MQDVEALGAFVTGNNIAHGVVAHVAHVDAAGRIGEHFKDIVFVAGIVVVGDEDVLVVPDLLPARFDFARIVPFRCHQMCRLFLPPDPADFLKD